MLVCVFLVQEARNSEDTPGARILGACYHKDAVVQERIEDMVEQLHLRQSCIEAVKLSIEFSALDTIKIT